MYNELIQTNLDHGCTNSEHQTKNASGLNPDLT